MTDDEAAGLWWGLFVGDAMGVPLEFTPPNLGAPVTTFTSGGCHNASKGEYSDDGAMALAIADAYIQKRGFCGSTIQQNFLDWMNTGKFGTRPDQPAWDIGMTVSSALNRVKHISRPYAGSTDPESSGNGCIMRLAPCIIWNRHSLSAAIGESVAQCLLTHGSADSIAYTAALAHELWVGKPLPEYDHLRDRPINNSGYFARPFASWERGSNENFNGLLRQYVPKKRSMNTVGEEEITMIQNRLNNRPRKRLGFKTPSEVFHQSLKRVALRT